MPLVSTDAVVLHVFDYLETSRIVRLATRDLGVVSCLARGARRSTKRFGAALDLFASGVAELQVKTGRDLHGLVSFDVTRARAVMGLDLDRFATASMLTELGLRFMAEEEHPALFASLELSLNALEQVTGGAARMQGLAAGWHLIAVLGFAPTVDLCCRCHNPISGESDALFSHEGGGSACVNCERAVPPGRRVPAAARDLLRAWCAGVHPPDVALDPFAQRAHERLLQEFVRHHVSGDQELRAFSSWLRGSVARTVAT